MHDAARGEHIASGFGSSSIQGRAGAGTLRGLFRLRGVFASRCRSQVEADRHSEVQAVPGSVLVFAEARERSPGEIPARSSLDCPGRANPKGASSSGCANHVFGCQGLSGGLKPRNRGWPGWFSPWARASPAGKTVCGSIRSETFGCLPRGESSEGRIPRAPLAWNKASRGSKGVSRREGNQTLRADRSGQVKPVWSGPSYPNVLKGERAQERSRQWCRLGSVWWISIGRPNSQKGITRGVDRLWRRPDRENRKAEDKSNSRVGAANQWVATSPGGRLCTSG